MGDDRGSPDRATRGHLEGGRNWYDSRGWWSIYESIVWRWVIGPIVFGTLVAAFMVLVFGETVEYGLAFAVWMTLFGVAMERLAGRRRRATEG